MIEGEKPSVTIRKREEYLFSLLPDLKLCKGFCQNNPWHIYDVYEHILHVVDGVPNDPTIRLAALFHDIGKPYVYTEDEKGIGHFYNHWIKSNEIFLQFAHQYALDIAQTEQVSRLIFYHDINFEKVEDNTFLEIMNTFSTEEIKLLFMLKRSDLLAQSSKYHNLLERYEEQEKRLILIKSYRKNQVNKKDRMS